jgi:hypothetical protein
VLGRSPRIIYLLGLSVDDFSKTVKPLSRAFFALHFVDFYTDEVALMFLKVRRGMRFFDAQFASTRFAVAAI